MALFAWDSRSRRPSQPRPSDARNRPITVPADRQSRPGVGYWVPNEALNRASRRSAGRCKRTCCARRRRRAEGLGVQRYLEDAEFGSTILALLVELAKVGAGGRDHARARHPAPGLQDPARGAAGPDRHPLRSAGHELAGLGDNPSAPAATPSSRRAGVAPSSSCVHPWGPFQVAFASARPDEFIRSRFGSTIEKGASVRQFDHIPEEILRVP
jgi:hypothetical protein